MQNCFKLKKKEDRYDHYQAINNNNGNRDRENCDSQEVVFAATSKNEKFKDDICFFDNGSCGHYCNFSKRLFNIEEIKECITVGHGKGMIVPKVGSLKCRIIQVDAFGLDITLHEFKFIPKI
jgi:hypothetical protein